MSMTADEVEYRSALRRRRRPRGASHERRDHHPSAPRRAGTRGVTAGGVLRSEWLKLVTVRSTFWTTLVALLLAGAIALLAGAAIGADRDGSRHRRCAGRVRHA